MRRYLTTGALASSLPGDTRQGGDPFQRGFDAEPVPAALCSGISPSILKCSSRRTASQGVAIAPTSKHATR
jgi:hypothetical protein